MSKLRGWLVWLVIVLSVALNIVQAKRVIDLQRQIERGGRGGGLAVGTHVPELHAKDRQGRDLTLRFEPNTEKPTILYFFSPSCVWCRRNAGNLNSLVSQISNKYQFVGLSLKREGLDEFADESHLSFPVYADAAPETLDAYGLRSTPQTIVISKGTVVASWPGAFVGDTKAQIEKFFGIHLEDHVENQGL